MRLLTSQVHLVVKDTTRFTSRADCDECGRDVRELWPAYHYPQKSILLCRECYEKKEDSP